MRPPSLSRALGPAALLLGLLIWTSCSELPTAPPTDWEPNFDHGSGGANGTPIAEVVPTDLGTLGGLTSFGRDVNDARWVVGAAKKLDGFEYAFLKRPNLPMEDLGAADFSVAAAVNNNGQVVGTHYINFFDQTAFLWTAGTLVDLQGCCTKYEAFGLNDASPAVIVGTILDPEPFNVFRPVRWTATNTSPQFLPENNNGGAAYDVNNSAMFVGQARFDDLRGSLQAALWATEGPAAQRGPLPGDVTSAATAINENFPVQIVGWSGVGIFDLTTHRPFILLQGGGAGDPPQALALGGFDGGEAQDINDDQVVVGWLIDAGGKRAAIWPSPTAEPILLRGPDDNPDGISEARGINVHCDVVGTITTAAGDSHAALWEVGGCDGAFDPGAPGTVVGPEGGNVPVVDGTGTVQGTVNIPAGALPNGTLIQAEVIGDANCVNVDGAEGPCVQITIPPGTVINDGFSFVVGLCFADPDPRPGFAVFRTDEDGTVVLRSVPVELDCSEGSLGGETGKFSNFQYGPQMLVTKARVKNKRRSRKDEIEIKGTFDFAGGGFDPGAEDVTITFGECKNPPDCTTNLELFLAGADFEREGRGKFKFESENRNRKIKVEIRRNGRFEIKVKGMEVGGIDLEIVSFMMQIGDQTQGVGLEFDNRGRCVRANGSPGCGNDEDDEDDEDDDDDDQKRRSADEG